MLVTLTGTWVLYWPIPGRVVSTVVCWGCKDDKVQLMLMKKNLKYYISIIIDISLDRQNYLVTAHSL